MSADKYTIEGVKMNKFHISILLILLYANAAFTQSADYFNFIENKGQWADSIKYKAELPDGMLALSDKGFAYHYISGEDMQRIESLMDADKNVDSEIVHLHNYYVHYTGANKEIQYTTADKRSRYNNYFIGKDPAKWRSNVGFFGKVIQHNVYNGVDVAIYSKGSSLKYDFAIAPGGNPDQINLTFEGVQPVLTKEGNLKIKTSVNEVVEQAPYAYQLVEGKKVTVACNFKLSDNQLSFELPDGYNPEYTLIIDPELVFVTFSGGGDFNAGYFSFCTTYDEDGCLYAAGAPIRGFGSTVSWPVTPGAFQTEWTSIYEPMVCINKYNASGSGLVYSTYYGGSGPNDLPHAMIVNKKGELILAGSTGSFNLPVTPGCFDSTKSGGTDIFIAHFNKDCTALIGATYMGGNTGQSINGIDLFSTSGLSAGNRNKTSPIELALDPDGNIWVACNTSAIDFPTTSNAFQPSFIGGSGSDGVIFSLDPTCSRMLYGTYIGGNGVDVVYGIHFNHAGHVVICGGTKSSDFPTTKEALLPKAPGSGDWDGFVTILDPVSGDLLHSTYLGTGKDDQAVNIQIDREDNIYVLGRTFGNYPITSDVYAMPNTDLFIDKLSPGLDTSFLSTRLGNPQSSGTAFFPTAFLLDNCDQIYVTGLSQNYEIPLADMPLTPDAFQIKPANFWFGVLKPNFSDLFYATYFGRAEDSTLGITGDHTHVGSHRLDPQGILYQSLCVQSKDYPGTTPQSWSQFNQNNSGQDIVSFKFAFNLSGVVSRFNAPPDQKDSGCAPYTVTFENRSSMAMDYFWDFGDGSPVIHNEPNPTHTYKEEGVFQVALYVHNDTTCITDDTSYKNITVFNPKIPDITVQDTLICSHEKEITLDVGVNNPSDHNRFLWQPASGIISDADKNTVIVDPNVDTIYTVTVWDTIPGFCGYSITDTVRIDYKPRSLDILNNDTLICLGGDVPMIVDGTEGYIYKWSPEKGVYDPSDQNPVIIPGQTETYTVTASYPDCPDTARSITIAVDNPVAVGFSSEPDSVCVGESITFYPHTDSTAVNIHWQFGEGMTLTSGNGEMVRHAYDMDGIMTVLMNTRFRACPDSSFIDTVHVYALPEVYLGPDTSLCMNATPLILSNRHVSSGIQHYLWNTGDTTEKLKVTHPGIYTLTIANDPLSCSTTESIAVTKDCYMDIPNAFTPDGDGANDYFFPRQLLSKSITQFRMQVFNRWGQLVFETDSLAGSGWDGKFNGKEQPQGVYIYSIVAEIDGETERYNGNVTLIR